MRPSLLLIFVLIGCGGAKETPCSGATCIDVSGNYTVTASSPPSGNTCKHIVYVAGAADGGFAAPFSIAQNGSDLTFDFAGSGVAFAVEGTLFSDKTASFQKHLPHITISNSDGTSSDYADDTQIQLTFTQDGDGSLGIVGSLRDNLTANGTPIPDDTACLLTATLNGHR